MFNLWVDLRRGCRRVPVPIGLRLIQSRRRRASAARICGGFAFRDRNLLSPRITLYLIQRGVGKLR